MTEHPTIDPNTCAVSGARLLMDDVEVREWMTAHIARLEAETTDLKRQLAAFADSPPAPSDVPDPPKRPDGTLLPQPKPWSAPRPQGDPRRIGG